MFHDTNTPRLRASPLARSRARDWQIDLAGIEGTGPNGRIVLSDVEVGRDRLVAAANPPEPKSPVLMAYTVSGSTTELTSLLDSFSKAGTTISVEALVLRLVAATAIDSGLCAKETPAIQFESPNGPLACPDLALSSVGSIERHLFHENGSGQDCPEIGLSVRVDRDAGIAPVLVPLWQDLPRRLIVSLDDADGSYRCLLVCDHDRMSENECREALGLLRGYLANPLGGIC